MTSGRKEAPDPRATTAAVKAIYRSDPEREWERMDRHRTEFSVTMRALTDHLPKPPAKVLDCGGGPGRYAIALAHRGYDVTLFDLSPELLTLAHERAAEAGVSLTAIEEGTAVDLTRFNDDTFDAVLLMGPLYHLLDRANRHQALTEAYRVVKPGGPVFAAFIGRYAAHIDGAARYPDEAVEHPEIYELIEETGLLPPSEDGTVGFVAYFAHPTEVRPLCKNVGFDVETVLGVEGVCSQRDEEINALEGAAWERWVDINYRIAQDPSTHGGVEHLLAVCRKPKWRSVLRRLAQTLDEEAITYRVVGSAALALHGIDVTVHDLDLEMSEADANRFQARFEEHMTLPLAWRETETIRSHYGKLEIDGVNIDIMADLERKVNDRWVPSLCNTCDTLGLDKTPVTVLTLEEEVLAQLRRGRLGRVAKALPACNADRLLGLLAERQATGWL